MPLGGHQVEPRGVPEKTFVFDFQGLSCFNKQDPYLEIWLENSHNERFMKATIKAKLFSVFV